MKKGQQSQMQRDASSDAEKNDADASAATGADASGGADAGGGISSATHAAGGQAPLGSNGVGDQAAAHKRHRDPELAVVRSFGDLADKYDDLATPDEYVGPANDRSFLDYGRPVLLADSSRRSQRTITEERLWDELLDDR